MRQIFRYKADIAQELGKTRSELGRKHQEVKDEILEDLSKISDFVEQPSVRLAAIKARLHLEQQPFAQNMHGVCVLTNVRCYRVDDVGFWFSFKTAGCADRQTYSVTWQDIKQNKLFGLPTCKTRAEL